MEAIATELFAVSDSLNKLASLTVFLTVLKIKTYRLNARIRHSGSSWDLSKMQPINPAQGKDRFLHKNIMSLAEPFDPDTS